MKVPVHVFGGFLGSGKTTAIRGLLASRQGVERIAVVVNDFGEAAIDATQLSDGTAVTNIPGGCVCCTAPAGLPKALQTILDELRPDRILIEPSGLARPQDVVDMIGRGAVAARLDRRPTVVMVDPRRDDTSHLHEDQLTAADVVVLNFADCTPPERLAQRRAAIAARWPPPLAVIETSHGALPPSVLEGTPVPAEHDGHHHAHDHGPSTAGYVAVSRVYPPEVVFDWGRVRAAVAGAPGLERFKGLFRTDLGWFRLDRVGAELHPDTTVYRRDSRFDAIFTAGSDPDALLAPLKQAIRPADAQDRSTLRLADGGAVERLLDRAALAALPDQVPDVGALVPGRKGRAVPLVNVLALLAPDPAARLVVIAHDGLIADPVEVGRVGDALLVHSLGEGPLPDADGGPFRLLIPPGEGRSACANVKGVAQLRLLAPAT